MKLLLATLWTDLRRDPVRWALTVAGLAVGVAIVTVTVNVGTVLQSSSSREFSTPGVRMIVATAAIENKGDLRYDDDILKVQDVEALKGILPSARAVTPVEGLWVTPQSGVVDFGKVRVGDTSYRTRAAMAVGAEYQRVYDLHMASGSFFTAADMEEGRSVLVLSEDAARGLFGTADAALGKAVTAVRMPGSQRVDYTVVGVYAKLPESVRDFYGVADFLLPLRLPPQYLGAFAVLMDAPSPAAASTLLKAAVRSLHGQDTSVLAWQGSRWNFDPAGQRRSEYTTVTIFMDGFGALALIIAATGVFTMLMIGIVERTRSIGLRRALGSTRAGIVGWFLGEAAVIAAAGALLGMGLAALVNTSAMTALAPIIGGDGGPSPLAGAGLRLDSLLISFSAALAASAVFGLFPALSAARTDPAESMRET